MGIVAGKKFNRVKVSQFVNVRNLTIFLTQ